MNTSLDPAFNLALEETFLHRIEPGHPGYAILWQNKPTLVVGRFQNTRQEINAAFVRENNIAVVRRMTGGGTVYHDEGTLNYTFIHHLGATGTLPSFSEAGKPIAMALQQLGLPVTFSGRNDLLLNGRKVAGVAHCQQGQRFLHHGCILVSTDLDRLELALHVDPEKYRSKGVASVRGRVDNLADYPRPLSAPKLTVERVREAILTQRSGETYTLTDADITAITQLRDEKYTTWDWTYGASPPFTEHKSKRFSWGKLEVFLAVRAGAVESCRFAGDFFAGTPRNTNPSKPLSSAFPIPYKPLPPYSTASP
ncbi:MAG: lipoate--protein ligase [Bilophila sp.]